MRSKAVARTAGRGLPRSKFDR